MILLILLFFLILAGNAEAATRWVVASAGLASGTCTTTGTACTAVYAKSIAVAGDTVRWRDGSYTGLGEFDITTGGTSNANRITYESENRHGAIIESDCGSQIQTVRIRASFITFRGFQIDGNNCNWIAIDVYHSDAGAIVNGVVLEDNWLHDLGGRGIRFLLVTNATVRYNIIEETGQGGDAVSCCSESIYISSATAAHAVTTLEGYGNTFREVISNVLDQKDNGQGLNWHHNLIENHGPPGVGEVTNDPASGILANNDVIGGVVSKFQNNIIRNGGVSNLYAILRTQEKNLDVTNNVIHDMIGQKAMSIRDVNGANQNWTNNTWCNTPTTVEELQNGTVADTTGNLFNQAQAVCDAEVARITAEIAARPVLAAGACVIADATPTIIDCAWTNNKFPPLSSATNASFTATVAGVSRKIDTTTIIGTNITRHTLASAVTTGQAVLLTGSLGAVVNSGLVGATWISDLSSSAVFSSFVVTNNVAGAPDTSVLSQVGYRLTRENNQIAVNTPISTPLGTVLLVDAQFNCTVANCPAAAVKMVYSQVASPTYPGSYSDVAATLTNGVAFLGNSAVVPFIPAEGTAVAACLSGTSGVDVAGAVQRTPNAVPNIDLAQNDCATNAYAVVFDTDPAIIGNSYWFCWAHQEGTALNGGCDEPARVFITDFGGVVATGRAQATGRTAATGRTQATGRLQVSQ